MPRQRRQPRRKCFSVLVDRPPLPANCIRSAYTIPAGAPANCNRIAFTISTSRPAQRRHPPHHPIRRRAPSGHAARTSAPSFRSGTSSAPSTSLGDAHITTKPSFSSAMLISSTS